MAGISCWNVTWPRAGAIEASLAGSSRWPIADAIGVSLRVVTKAESQLLLQFCSVAYRLLRHIGNE